MNTTTTRALMMLAIGSFLAAPVAAQDQEPQEGTPYVTQQALEAMQQDLEDTLSDYDASFDDIDSQLALLDALRPGTRNVTIAGSMSFNYVDSGSGPSVINGAFEPVLLFHLRDDLMIESELEFGVAPGVVELEYAQLLYAVNDSVTVGIGKFIAPLGQFRERYHPAWINKLPDMPMYAGEGGMTPHELVGAQVRGGIRTGGVQWKYVLFAADGAKDSTPASPGDVKFDFEPDGVDFSQSKAIGGRIGVLPVSWMEFGVSGYSGKPSDVTGSSVGDLTIFMLDLAAHRETPLGFLRFDVETVSTKLDSGVSETWTGGYTQAALRPNFGGGPSAFEGVVRYDWMGFPSTIASRLEPTRWTAGIDYWLDESTVIKLAVESIDVDGETQNSFLLETAIGF